MKRLFALVLLFLLISLSPQLPTRCFADSYEAVTIDNTSGGVALTAATYARAQSALCRLETAEIRFTHDGTNAPTTTAGIPLEPLEWLVLDSPDRIRNFRAIRTGGTSGSLKCIYFAD